MNLELAADLWSVLSEYIDLHDKPAAAETLVTLLIENNYEADDIKDSFRQEKHVLTALKEYITAYSDEEEYEDYEDEEE